MCAVATPRNDWSEIECWILLETDMKKRLSEHTFDELLLMPRAQFIRLLAQSIAKIRQILDPDGDFAEQVTAEKQTTHNQQKQQL